MEISQQNLREDGKGGLLEEGRVVIVGGDGSQGLPEVCYYYYYYY